MMKHSIRSLLILTVAAVAITGCKKNPYGVTPLRGPGSTPMTERRSDPLTDPGAGRLDPREGTSGTPLVANPNGIPLPGADFEANFNQDPAPLKAQTAYFDYDSSAVKRSEQDKLKAVVDYLNSNTRNALLIEGHCDERGTEEYNRALGERRALALREFLANSGINPARIVSKSFGEDRPAATGHDDAAWSKNRRGDFIVLIPK